MSTDSPLSQWLHEEMPRRGYPLGGPRSGGISRLAADAGIPQATMSRLVHGQAVEVSTDNLRKLGKVFGKTVGEMMVIAGLAEAEEVGQAPTPERPFQVIDNPDREKSIEEEVGGWSKDPDAAAVEIAIAAVEHAPRQYRIDMIKAGRVLRAMREEDHRAAGRGS